MSIERRSCALLPVVIYSACKVFPLSPARAFGVLSQCHYSSGIICRVHQLFVIKFSAVLTLRPQRALPVVHLQQLPVQIPVLTILRNCNTLFEYQKARNLYTLKSIVV